MGLSFAVAAVALCATGFILHFVSSMMVSVCQIRLLESVTIQGASRSVCEHSPSLPPPLLPSLLAQLDGVNTIYICFAFDRDRKIVTHPEIHQVFEGVPTLKGALIEQPDGGVAYGAPSSTQQSRQPIYSSPPPPYGQQQPPAYGQPAYPSYPPQQASR